MSYGGASFGSAAIGGNPASRVVFFTAFELALSVGFHRRSAEYTGSAAYFEIIALVGGQLETPERIMRIYTHNDPAETPQLQTAVGLSEESFYSQSIIGAARFITVEMEQVETPILTWFGLNITGNEYFQ